MAGLPAGPFFGSDYDPQRPGYSYPSRMGWPEHYPFDQNDSRTPQHLQDGLQHPHDANSNPIKRSTTPLPMTSPLYEQQTIRPQPALSLPLQEDGHDYHRQTVAGLSDFRQQNQGSSHSYEDTLFPNQLFGTPLAGHPTYAASMSQQHHSDFPSHSHTGLNPSTAAWAIPPQSQAQAPYSLHTEATAPTFTMQNFPVEYQTSPTELIGGSEPQYGQYQTSYLPLNSHLDNMPFGPLDLPDDLGALPATTSQRLPDPHAAPALLNSPTGSSPEVGSYSGSENSWIMLDNPNASSVIFNPGETLHPRTGSNSSQSDHGARNRHSFGSFVDVVTNAAGSPTSDCAGETYLSASHSSKPINSPVIKQEPQDSSPVLPRATVKSVMIKPGSPRTTDRKLSPPSGRMSPPARKQSKKGVGKTSKPAIRKQTSPVKSEIEKKVGRRKGPLRPEQREQACQIRKLGACLRCKYLKKTCDTKEQCEGCQAHHTRLWNIPCVRIDIRDLGNFLKDWKDHFEQTIPIGWAINNIKTHKTEETTLYITHGYGYVLPIQAREVVVRDERCFSLDWVEQDDDRSISYTVQTAKYSTGMEGVSPSALSKYLDRHIEADFEKFVDDYYGGTPFVTEMLKVVHAFYRREGSPIIRKALKMLLAYNFTHHITMLEGVPEELNLAGRILAKDSRYYNKVATPVMINFEVKVAMSTMWKDLQKEVLDDLSPLYQSIYTKEKFRNWPTIFMVLMILLSVWEEIQFDYHYRIQDREVVRNFCNEMESIPVKVLVGLFTTVSQRLPSFYDWKTADHHEIMYSNNAVCDAMTQVRQHVEVYDDYLRSRCDTTFNPDDFDSLSNKFTSQLVLRSTA